MQGGGQMQGGGSLQGQTPRQSLSTNGGYSQNGDWQGDKKPSPPSNVFIAKYEGPFAGLVIPTVGKAGDLSAGKNLSTTGNLSVDPSSVKVRA